jgi:hypothetical protein
MTRLSVSDAIISARAHVSNGCRMESSARLCLADAVALFDKGDHEAAGQRAVKSLAYSVGILHPDYQRAVKAIGA